MKQCSDVPITEIIAVQSGLIVRAPSNTPSALIVTQRWKQFGTHAELCAPVARPTASILMTDVGTGTIARGAISKWNPRDFAQQESLSRQFCCGRTCIVFAHYLGGSVRVGISGCPRALPGLHSRRCLSGRAAFDVLGLAPKKSHYPREIGGTFGSSSHRIS